MRTKHLKSIDSTNDYIKKFIKDRENIAVFSDVQTHGRGTKGRNFLSDMGGVFCSILSFYTDMVPANSFRIMTHAAVSVCRTLKEFGIAAEIKWPNDVRAADRKIAGILIENQFRDNTIDYSIVGIGLNVSNDVSALGDIAVNMKELLGVSPPVKEVGKRLLANYLRPSDFEEYLTYVRFLGDTIDVTEGEAHYAAVARRILPDGRLEVERDGELRRLSNAEIMLYPQGGI